MSDLKHSYFEFVPSVALQTREDRYDFELGASYFDARNFRAPSNYAFPAGVFQIAVVSVGADQRRDRLIVVPACQIRPMALIGEEK